ncbi:MAG: hypothetical protein LBG44_01900 [Gemmatimonadota bacterium]|nr:hypothetical protein [Gemmatimonadota bacterium]
MKRRYYLYTFLSALVLLFLLTSAREVWRYYAYANERNAIIRLKGEIEIAGMGAIATQSRADTLRREIEAIDDRLRENRQRLDLMERNIDDLFSAREMEAAYRTGLDFYNTEVGRRNALFESWRATVEFNHEHVGRYNLLADSIRALAAVMGEDHYPVASPSEIAARYDEIVRAGAEK